MSSRSSIRAHRTSLLVLGLVGLTAHGQTTVPGRNLAIETKVWVATKIYASIQMYNAHAAGAPDFDADRDYQQFLKAAFAPGADRRAFDLAAMAYVGKLRNGHSGFYDSWLSKNYGRPLGFTLQPMAEGWVVSESRLADLSPGDVVTAVDGDPIDHFYETFDGLIEGSSPATRRQRFSWQTYLWPDRFDLALAGGKHVAIDRTGQKLMSPRSLFSANDVTPPAGVGYIRIQSFEDPETEKSAINRVKELKDSPAIVFDVRGNGGGSTPTGLISALLDRPWHDFGFTTPLHIAHAGAQTQIRHLYPKIDLDPYLKGYVDAFDEFNDAQILTPGPIHLPAPDAYKGKIFLLIDNFCNSACEDFAEPFKASGRGTLVGQRTNGSSGQPYMVDFGNGMNFRVSTKRYFLPDGTPFEGVGIRPDVEVTPTVDDWKAGRDPVLAAAFPLAARK